MKAITLEDLESLDLTGAVMSEKADGIHGRWDGAQLTTRNGSPLNPPEWWIRENLPNRPAIGELWLGRGTTAADACILFRADAPWSGCKFIEFATIAKIPCGSAAHVRECYRAILDAEGEGLVIESRQGTFKLKPWRDGEAEIIGTAPGKYSWRIAGLRCRTADGLEFTLSAGLSEAERMKPPQGMATYSFAALSASGIPLQAVFRGVRDERTMP